MLDVCSCCGTLHFSSARVSPSKSARQAARGRRHGMARMLRDTRVSDAGNDMGNQTRTTGAWCTLSPVLRTGTCARSCVLRVWCLLSGQICYTEFCPGTSLNNTAVGSPIYLQCCSCAFKTSKLPPLPRGTDSRHAGLHTARPRASAGRRRPASGRGGVGPPNTTPSPPRGGPLGTAAWLEVRQLCG